MNKRIKRLPADYVPFGPEWEKEVMKNTKADIVAILKKACEDRDIARAALEEMARHAAENWFVDEGEMAAILGENAEKLKC